MSSFPGSYQHGVWLHVVYKNGLHVNGDNQPKKFWGALCQPTSRFESKIHIVFIFIREWTGPSKTL